MYCSHSAKANKIVKAPCFPYDGAVDIEDIFSRPLPVRGVIAIRNLRTGRTYLEKTEDAVKAFSSERFSLDLAMHPCTELQEEYASLGLELFTIELDTEADDGDDLDALLEKRRRQLEAEGISLYRT